MRRVLLLCIALGASISCKKANVDLQNTPCESPYADTKRSARSADDVPATIIAVASKNVGSQNSVYQILPSDGSDMDGSNRVPWGPCNLPLPFRRDSLKVTVSGYLLTSPFLDVANVSPLPFEITNIKRRK